MKHCLICFGLIFSTTLFALEMPTGNIILTINGMIENTNNKDSALFDIDMLNQLPQKTIRTRTPWNEGKHIYRGVSPESLFQFIGAQGKILHLMALNNYTIDIPIEDFLQLGAIFATHMDSVPMTVRNKGPIMVIYPFDDNPNLKAETYYSRSIWQVKTITIQ